MAISPSNVQRQHNGVYAETSGDGASTQLTIPWTGYIRSRSMKAFVTADDTTAVSNLEKHSNYGGFRFPGVGTVINGCTASVTGNSITVTCGSPVNNGKKAYVVALFLDRADS